LEQLGRLRLNIDNPNPRAVAGEQIDKLPPDITAQVRGIPGKIAGLTQECPGLFASGLKDRALLARRRRSKGFANRVK
jgi:hypothetical protein